MTVDSLKPCPFCGGRGAIASTLGDKFAYCESCWVETPYCADPITAWNTRARVGDGWQPIETAPRDGTWVLTIVATPPERYQYMTGRPFVVRWDDAWKGWNLYPGFGGVPDNWFRVWMPINLPDAPRPTGDQP